jgi:Family of unknown function (DUF6459)
VRVIDLLREARVAQPEPVPEVIAAREPAVQIGSDEAAALVTAVVRPLLEVLEGRRPLRQLSALLEPAVRDRLELMLSPGARRVRNSDLRLHKVRVCQPDAAAIEACAVVQAGPRFRAIALRLERHGPRWTCTALRLG